MLLFVCVLLCVIVCVNVIFLCDTCTMYKCHLSVKVNLLTYVLTYLISQLIEW